MTREEAIKELQGHKGIIIYPSERMDAALNMAISALEQGHCKYWKNGKCNGNTEQCEDAVSRDAVMGLVAREHTEWDDLYIDIAKLPSVTVRQSNCDSCEYLDRVDDACPIYMSSKRQTGEWITKKDVIGVAYCSECGFELRINNTNYCPNCGCRYERRE